MNKKILKISAKHQLFTSVTRIEDRKDGRKVRSLQIPISNDLSGKDIRDEIKLDK